jgi:putative membrane protein
MRVVTLSPAERDRIADTVRSAEAGTSGEIYVVVARAADDYRFVPIVWAALSALLVPWPLYLFTDLSISTMLFIQAATFVCIAVIASHPAIRYRIVPKGIVDDAARKAAQTLFLAHGVHLTEARTGVLIYVALADRRVEIVADAGINAKADQSDWDELARDVVDAARAGRLADGLVSAVRRAGTLLARHCPRRPGDRNELPNRVVEIR